MLTQEINLFQPNGKKTEAVRFPDWIHYYYCAIAFLGIITLVLIFSTSKLYYLKIRLNTLHAQETALENKFYTLKQNYPSFFFSQNVSETIANIKKQLASQNKILATIENQAPFSGYFSILPALITSDVWLTGININTSDASITLKGKSRSVKNLQIFISQLLKDKFFSNSILNIKNIGMDDNKSNNGELLFEISLVKH